MEIDSDSVLCKLFRVTELVKIYIATHFHERPLETSINISLLTRKG